MLKRVFLFLVLNFSALGIGSLYTTAGVSSDWYQTLNKAPWTPPGWMFGVAWTTIMICFAIYMALLIPKTDNRKKIIGLFVIQWVLNTSWNPIFFYLQQTVLGLFVILSLTSIVSIFLFQYRKNLQLNSLWIAPYFIWLLIASSLNAYIILMN
ncbi:TspO/MBR family protein [Wenyingzhuangia sp. 2_MG-2023]|nr:TspO/MBR family protein [Wenyingzhuangia sp. 2_MG-2023]MDO6737208.1 TspO/MBR family protein [Wenyingzhuangia sp. 2_MG-2023]